VTGAEENKVGDVLKQRVNAEYRNREISYPVEWILDQTLGGVSGDVMGLTVEVSEVIILLTFAAR
jgi:hypothetical protein